MKRASVVLALVTAMLAAPSGARADLGAANVKLTLLTDQLTLPMAIAWNNADSTYYIAEKVGRVRPIDLTTGALGTPALSIRRHVSAGNEQGLLGLTFSADGTKLYVYFTSRRGSGPSGDDVLREYQFTAGHAVKGTARDLFRLADPYNNHNGGNLAFGPDGYLYVAIGDGGSYGDPQNRSQNLRSMFGKMLRIDPTPSSTKPFTIPPDNPFVGAYGNDAIWARGLRNPWRWSFDKTTGDLWIGDVGQTRREEVDFQPAGAPGGDNYGWHRMEGTLSYNGGTPPPDHHPPTFEYAHKNNNCAIIGGYVYRGAAIADLAGAYVYADLCVGNVRAFSPADPAGTVRDLGPHVDAPTSFAQDQAGELYVMTFGGKLYRLDQAP